MSTLAIPDPSPTFDVGRFEADLSALLAMIEEIDDIGQAEELRARAAALEEYLARRADDATPAMTATRHIEARIGALLGPAVNGSNQHSGALSRDSRLIPPWQRKEFRLLDRYRVIWEAEPGRPRRQIVKAIDKYRRRVVDADARAITTLEVDDETGDGWALLVGDLADRAVDIVDASVDLIVTDPPYATETLDRWALLAEQAARMLKPQGILVALSGQIILPEVLARLRQHLAYGWIYAQPLPGSNSRILARHVGQTWKPWLAFSNGPWPSGRVDWHPDTLDGAPMAKTLYHWQQSTGAAAQLIHFLAPENGLVLDPYAGTATYGVAALQTERRFVGIEADTGRFTQAAARLVDHS